MVSILDQGPAYPWSNSDAQQLHLTLCQLHPTGKSAGWVAQEAGINIFMVNTDQAPAFVWKDMLDESAKEGKTRTLVAKVRDLATPSSPGRPLLEALLANVVPRTEAQPLAANGAPSFFVSDDTVTQPEALLYYDDLTIQIGRVPGIIATLQRLVALAPSVCKLSVDMYGALQKGTAFRIDPNHLLTNWHVFHLKDGTRATAVTAEFGYEDDGGGGALAAEPIPCDVKSIAGSQQDDWAVISATQPLKASWPVVKLSEAVAPATGGAAYIIQHPGGQRKRLGFVRNQISYIDDRVVQYLTDTKEGSSGSPVFNEQGKLIALHHAGGRPQEVLGKAPVKKNEGIRISRVVAGLQTLGIATP